MRVGGRRLLAVLAGGTVLVGGGVTTLAAWQDQAYDAAPLSLSSFNVQQTLDGTTFSENDTAGTALQLALSVNGTLGGALTPGNATTGWVGLRAAAGSLGGTVTMSAPAVGTDVAGLAPHLTYQAVAGVDAATCKAGGVLPTSGTGVTALVADGSSMSAAGATSFAVPAGTGGAVGTTVGVCIRLKLDASLPRTFSATGLSPVWTFSATSSN